MSAIYFSSEWSSSTKNSYKRKKKSKQTTKCLTAMVVYGFPHIIHKQNIPSHVQYLAHGENKNKGKELANLLAYNAIKPVTGLLDPAGAVITLSICIQWGISNGFNIFLTLNYASFLCFWVKLIQVF